jgi:beta-glucosidase
VIANVNVTLAWELGNVEPYIDALTVGFDTYPKAILDVILGRFSPVGKLPLTLPRGDEVLKVNADGVCISPNDVPGYDKDQYMPESLKDENGKAYAYRDTEGNYYELNFGLNFD